MKLCTTCGDEYDESVEICPRDGTPLFAGEFSEAVEDSEPVVEETPPPAKPEPIPSPVAAAPADLSEEDNIVGDPDLAAHNDPTQLMEIGDAEDFRRRALEAAGVDVDDLDEPDIHEEELEPDPPQAPPVDPHTIELDDAHIESVEEATEPPWEDEPAVHPGAWEEPVPPAAAYDAAVQEFETPVFEPPSAQPPGPPFGGSPPFSPATESGQPPIPAPGGPQGFRPPDRGAPVPAAASQSGQFAGAGPVPSNFPAGSGQTGELSIDQPQSSKTGVIVVVIVLLVVVGVVVALALGVFGGGTLGNMEAPEPKTPLERSSKDEAPAPEGDPEAAVESPPLLDAGAAAAVDSGIAGRADAARENEQAAEVAPEPKRQPKKKPRKRRKKKQPKPSTDTPSEKTNLDVWGGEKKKGGNPDELLPIN